MLKNLRHLKQSERRLAVIIVSLTVVRCYANIGHIFMTVASKVFFFTVIKLLWQRY